MTIDNSGENWCDDKLLFIGILWRVNCRARRRSSETNFKECFAYFDSARRSPDIIAFIGLTIGIGRGGVLLRTLHEHLSNLYSGGAEPLPYKGLCTLEELCELHSLQFLLRRAESKNAKHSLKFVSELRRRALQFVRRNTATNSNLNNRRSAKQSLQDRFIMHSAFQRL